MNWFTRLRYRTVSKDEQEAEGICELYFNELEQAEAFVEAARASEDLEGLEIFDVEANKIIYSWEK